ncbi:hypothetical protein JQX13_13200 [Archangium violaceum]|uniref:hypothetical protein n=1 Tax=Archangium violaceum TaxID=83451 RepID=UPI00193B90F2|nr:hypothetical protein [Archangium violaceum]QRK10939.1 hypothetical protein JQX13_13200 [Archangium violaceum]
MLSRYTFVTRLFMGVLLAWLPVASAQAPAARPSPQVSAVVPVSITPPFSDPEKNLPYFDDFAWREFIALTWPAQKGRYRGLADNGKRYGDVSVPGVWETWKADYELFLPGGAAPATWNSFDTLSPCDPNERLAPYTKYLASFDRFHGFNQAGLKRQAGPLVSQNRQYVRYEFRVNNTQYNFIINPPSRYPGPLYLAENLHGGTDNPLEFPFGSIGVKASWRIMTGVPPEQWSRYYVTQANVLDPVSGRCTPTPVGLIGLHIVNKVVGFPNWIWATFEHVDNVPAIPGEKSQGRAPYALNNGDPTTPPSPMGRPIDRCNPPRRDPEPTQVVRMRPIASSTQRTNEDYHAAPGVKGTVWENYQLVMTQWPTHDGTDSFPNARQPQPQTNTANVAAETWFQDSRSSCMACHGRANLHGFDGVWFLPFNAYPRPEVPCQSLLQKDEKEQE